MADYKAQSKSAERKIDGYLEDVYHEGYKLQLDFYRYLFEKNGFEVQTTAYFVVYNATLERDSFDNKLEFIEVQTGTYFGEDDIVRIDDDYGRGEYEHLKDHIDIKEDQLKNKTDWWKRMSNEK